MQYSIIMNGSAFASDNHVKKLCVKIEGVSVYYGGNICLECVTVRNEEQYNYTNYKTLFHSPGTTGIIYCSGLSWEVSGNRNPGALLGLQQYTYKYSKAAFWKANEYMLK